jgi:hypothetical protein
LDFIVITLKIKTIRFGAGENREISY